MPRIGLSQLICHSAFSKEVNQQQNLLHDQRAQSLYQNARSLSVANKFLYIINERAAYLPRSLLSNEIKGKRGFYNRKLTKALSRVRPLKLVPWVVIGILNSETRRAIL